MIFHELRTPLSVLRGELEAIMDGIRPLTQEAIKSLSSDVMRLNQQRIFTSWLYLIRAL
ncbi:MAG: hypothetical protein KIT59_01405 [Nitrosomonas sp.]|nr:hypothetical protein [Nitrosomonas sp.]